MYCDYFDLQLELIDCFHPAVVGHFDLRRRAVGTHGVRANGTGLSAIFYDSVDVDRGSHRVDQRANGDPGTPLSRQ